MMAARVCICVIFREIRYWPVILFPRAAEICLAAVSKNWLTFVPGDIISVTFLSGLGGSEPLNFSSKGSNMLGSEVSKKIS